MRVRFEWIAEKPLELPRNYQGVLQGVIYNAMRDQYGHSSFIHSEGYQYGKRQYRMFCFSQIMGDCDSKGDKRIFRGPLFFDVTSPEGYMIHKIADNIKKNGLNLRGNYFPEVQILWSDYTVESEEIVIQMLSPICVYKTMDDGVSKYTHYYTPWEPEFSEAVCGNFLRKYEAYFGVPADEKIWIEPLDVKRTDRQFASYKNTKIIGYNGIYKLIGKQKYLDFLHQTGIGAKNSQGFGMFQEI